VIRNGIVVLAVAALAVPLVTGCGQEQAATTSAQQPAPTPAETTPSGSDLEDLVVQLAGFTSANRVSVGKTAGPFDAAAYAESHSTDPQADKARLSSAGFVDGLFAVRTSAGREERVETYLYRMRDAAGAKALQESLWAEFSGDAFPVTGVPGAIGKKDIAVRSTTNRAIAVARVSLVAGNLLANIAVQTTGESATEISPDTALAIQVAREQKKRLQTAAAKR
jgi:hypothetical protein